MSDRKYGQRGYQEDERPTGRRPTGNEGPPPPKKDGPRGRGLGAPTESVYACPQCAYQQPLAVTIEVGARCVRCSADLHCCANCRFFDTTTRFECRQTIPVRIANKRQGNNCELFDARTLQTFAKEASKPSGPKDPRAAFDALFRK